MARVHLIAARAEALFASDLSIHSHPTQAAVTAAIRRAVRAHGGIRGCAGEVGAAYGDYPETAAERMRWARHVVEATFSSGTRLAGAGAGAGAGASASAGASARGWSRCLPRSRSTANGCAASPYHGE